MKQIPLVLAAALLPLSALQQSGNRQPVTPTIGTVEEIRLEGCAPRGSLILGETPNAPPGYSATGWTLSVSTGIPPCTTLTSMPVPRTGAEAAAVNGKVYVLGGVNIASNYVAVAAVDEYDPLTDTWTTMPTPMPTPRHGHSVVVAGGRILVTGGRSAPNGGVQLTTVDEYDPVTDTWSGRSPMLVERSGHALVEVDGRVFAIGGDAGSSVEEYHQVADTWQFRAPMSVQQASSFGAASANGKAYVFGVGIQEYDPATDSWTLRSTQTLNGGFGVVAVNGRVFLISVTSLSEYNPITNTTTVLADLNTPRSDATLASTSEQIYALGGSNWNGFPTQDQILATTERLDLGAFQTLYVHRRN